VEDDKKSMADMAAKFADKDEAPEDNDEDDSSSFEEVQKPIERPTTKSTTETTPGALAGESISEPSKTTSLPVSELEKKDEPSASAVAAPAHSASAAAGGLRDVLQEIRGMLQSQGRQIEQLTSEVAQLKAKVGE
jgi:coronin-1B/1C/6